MPILFTPTSDITKNNPSIISNVFPDVFLLDHVLINSWNSVQALPAHLSFTPYSAVFQEISYLLNY
jgi:hypothetical protein